MMRFLPALVIGTAYGTPPTTDPCIALCGTNADCIAQSRGSYLKYWQDPPVCYAFYVNSDGYFYYFDGTGGDESAPMNEAMAQFFVDNPGQPWPDFTTTTTTETTTETLSLIHI